MAVRSGETRSPTASALLAFTVLVAAAGLVLTTLAWGDMVPSDAYPNLAGVVAAILYAALGALIVRRVGNRIGWMLIFEGLVIGIVSLASAYAIIGLVSHPGSLPGAKVIGTLAELIFIPTVVVLVSVLGLFPTGALPSRRWRPVGVATVAVTIVSLVGFVISPRHVGLPVPGGVSVTFPNPFAVRGVGRVAATALLGTVPALTVFSVVLFGVAMAALVVRYRSGSADLRQQIRWVALAGVAAVAAQAALALAQVMVGNGSPITEIAGLAAAVVPLIGLPLAITIAVLRYRLYDIDVIINRAVVYGLLAAGITAVYVVIVLGIGSVVGFGAGSPLLTTAAAVVVALLFQVVRRQAQRVANRIVYGERATPYQVLSGFAENVAGTLGFDEVLDRMVSVLADGTGATRVDVWIRVGSELRPSASWPREATAPPDPLPLDRDDDLPGFDTATRAVAVRQGAELLGALSLVKPRNEPLTVTEDKLLQDLASQAGLVFRNARLTAELRAKIEELRASRRRLVETQNTERRRIERNLHDGAQQQLVALKVQLGLVEKLAGDPDRVRAVAGQLQDALQSALDDLRDLARGIYPPLLADQGLAVALEAQARKAAVRTLVQSDGIGRYPEEIESAVYFCALEAMQNVGKYAGASTTLIRLSQTDGHLLFEVEDDGQGFDPDQTNYGTGLQGMADRLDAIGGSLEVESAPSRGTVVRGRIRLS